jgi:hypothetical protein
VTQGAGPSTPDRPPKPPREEKPRARAGSPPPQDRRERHRRPGGRLAPVFSRPVSRSRGFIDEGTFPQASKPGRLHRTSWPSSSASDGWLRRLSPICLIGHPPDQCGASHSGAPVEPGPALAAAALKGRRGQSALAGHDRDHLRRRPHATVVGRGLRPLAPNRKDRGRQEWASPHGGLSGFLPDLPHRTMAVWRGVRRASSRISVRSLVRPIRDIMCRDSGADGDAQRISRPCRMFFLRIRDHRRRGPGTVLPPFPGHPRGEGRPRMDASGMPGRARPERGAGDIAPQGRVGGRGPSPLSAGGGRSGGWSARAGPGVELGLPGGRSCCGRSRARSRRPALGRGRPRHLASTPPLPGKSFAFD